MNKNTKASQKFRYEKKKAGLTEIRGLFAPKAVHKAIKEMVKKALKL